MRPPKLCNASSGLHSSEPQNIRARLQISALGFPTPPPPPSPPLPPKELRRAEICSRTRPALSSKLAYTKRSRGREEKTPSPRPISGVCCLFMFIWGWVGGGSNQMLLVTHSCIPQLSVPHQLGSWAGQDLRVFQMLPQEEDGTQKAAAPIEHLALALG